MLLLFLKKFKLETQVQSYCHIKNNQVYLNGELLHELTASDDPAIYLSELYKLISLNYPKFHKMDKQCKLGVLAAELVLRSIPDFEHLSKEKIALVFSNRAASLESDRHHIQSIQDKSNYFPSPAVFVYTLPNIVIGEIAIKHKLTGENAFFISKTFDAETMSSYASILLQKHLAEHVLCGWVNVDGNSAEAFVYWLKNLNFNGAKNESAIPHTSQQIQHLYAK